MNRLEKERCSQGLTLEQLAEKAEVGLNTVWRIASGKSPGSRLSRVAIARALEIPVEEADTLTDELG